VGNRERETGHLALRIEGFREGRKESNPIKSVQEGGGQSLETCIFLFYRR